MRWITLTNSQLCTKVSGKDFARVNKYNWFLFKTQVKGSPVKYVVRTQHPQVSLLREWAYASGRSVK
jgi:hypothetical protein